MMVTLQPPSSTPGNKRIRLTWALWAALLPLAMLFAATRAVAATATATSLTISSTSAGSGTAVTLTATVSAGTSNVGPGQVAFCVAAASFCTDVHRLGSASLVNGSATLKFIPGSGAHTYKAIFLGTNAFASSTSPTVLLTVTPPHATATTIAQSGSQGNYTEVATVTGAGAIPPTGTLSILDVSNAGYVLGTGTLAAATTAFALVPASGCDIGQTPGTFATGDFNGDGIPDLVLTNPAANTLVVCLSHLNGTFTYSAQTLPANPSSPSTPIFLITGDFDNDGKPDLVVYQQKTTTNNNETLTLLAGNGDGTFDVSHPTDLGGFSHGQIFPPATGDFDGDGNADLAYLQEGLSGYELIVYRGNGDRTFRASETVFTSQTQTPYQLVAVDLNNDGRTDLLITTDTPALQIELGNSDGSFTSKTQSLTVTPGTSLVTADFNQDGHTDIGMILGSDITIFKGNGDGTFTQGITLTPVTSPLLLCVGDFNGDGRVDLAAALSGTSNNIAVHLGNGDGTFATTPSTITVNSPSALASGDFNGDGFSDIAVLPSTGTSVTNLLANPTSSSTATITNLSPVGIGTHQVLGSYTGDANFSASTSASSGMIATKVGTNVTLKASPTHSVFGQQVVLTGTLSVNTAQNHSTNGDPITFSTFPGRHVLGTGTLAGGVATLSLTSLPAGTNTIAASYAGDAYFTNTTDDTISYTVAALTSTTLTITSTGTTTTSAAVGTPITLTAMVVSGTVGVTTGQVIFCDASAPHCTDIHRLGTAQLTASGTATIRLVPAIGSHSYKAVFLGTPTDVGSSSASSSLTVTGLYPATTTLTATGTAGNYTLTATVASPSRNAPTGTVSFVDSTSANAVLGSSTLGTSTYSFGLGTARTLVTSSFPKAVATGDFNGDGNPDLAIINLGASTVVVELGNGNGTFTAATFPSATLANPDGIVIGDFNADGKQDLAITNASSSAISLLLGNGDGTFNEAAATPLGSTNALPAALTAADFNGDGKQDLAVADVNNNTVTLLLGNGDGTFTARTTLTTGNNPASVVAADFNNDGYPDLAVANVNDATVSVFLGAGDGTFAAGVLFPSLGGSYSLVAADLDGDGNADLALASSGGNTVTILHGNGAGSFTALASPIVATNPSAIAVGDVNGDGVVDLLTASSDAANTVSVLVGKGDGTFLPAQQYANATLLQGVALADFNHDGFTDLVTANYSAAAILLTQPLETASASIVGVAVTGSSTSHAVMANYAGDATHATGSSNSINLTALPLAATPVFFPAPGTYNSAQTVSLTTATAGATIFYTTDGTAPTSSSTLYTAPFAVTASETINAVALGTGYQNSAVASGVYNLAYPPIVTTQPVSRTINAGSTAVLSVTATGTAPLNYQWFAGTGPNTVSPIAGATGARYTTAALSATSSFWVRITSGAGVTADSSTAVITVITPPAITAQTPNPTINTGQSTTLRVTASGTAPAFQWYSSISPNTANPIAGAIASTYTTSILTANAAFWVRASNQAGVANSSTFVITVNQPPTCTITVAPGATALSAVATTRCTDPQQQALTASLDWGDGTVVAVTASNATAMHTYAVAGNFAVIVTATDTAGLMGTTTQSFSPNQSPVCKLGIVQGSASSTANVTVLVACTDPQNQMLTLSLDWGDGTIVLPTNNASNSHLYTGSNATSYNVVLSATDTSGLSGSSAPQPVTIVPAPPTASGGSVTVAASIPAPPVVPPMTQVTQVTFLCASVSLSVNNQAVNNVLPSAYGISCTSPNVTLSAAPTPVNVTIRTTATTTAKREDWSPFGPAGWAASLASLAVLLPIVSRKRRPFVAGLLAIILCVSLTACGGYFQAPPIIPTPVGTYYITLVETVVSPLPAPTGFIQTSLIVPLPVTAKP